MCVFWPQVRRSSLPTLWATTALACAPPWHLRPILLAPSAVTRIPHSVWGLPQSQILLGLRICNTDRPFATWLPTPSGHHTFRSKIATALCAEFLSCVRYCTYLATFCPACWNSPRCLPTNKPTTTSFHYTENPNGERLSSLLRNPTIRYSQLT